LRGHGVEHVAADALVGVVAAQAVEDELVQLGGDRLGLGAVDRSRRVAQERDRLFAIRAFARCAAPDFRRGRGVDRKETGMKKMSALTMLAAVALAGCTVGPDYARPVVDTPTAWRIDYPKAAEVANTKWWEQFGDPVLNDLIETALRENRDVRIAAARIDQFAGALTSTRSQLFPQIGYGADASRTRARTCCRGCVRAKSLRAPR